MIRITVLLENRTVDGALRPKHGLSIAIDTGFNHLLLDVGPDDTFIQNAETLNYDLAQVNTVILSHSHGDHTGGLDAFSELNSNASMLLFDDPRNRYYVKIFGLIPLDVSIKASDQTIRRIKQLQNNYQIDESSWFIKNTCAKSQKPKLNNTLYKKGDSGLIRDNFDHEGILVVEDKNELVVFNSCSHNGVCNSIESVRTVFPKKKIRAYVGGFHFRNPAGRGHENPEHIDQVCGYIKEWGVRVYTGHCTGDNNIRYLQSRLGEMVQRISTGSIIDL